MDVHWLYRKLSILGLVHKHSQLNISITKADGMNIHLGYNKPSWMAENTPRLSAGFSDIMMKHQSLALFSHFDLCFLIFDLSQSRHIQGKVTCCENSFRLTVQSHKPSSYEKLLQSYLAHLHSYCLIAGTWFPDKQNS